RPGLWHPRLRRRQERAGLPEGAVSASAGKRHHSVRYGHPRMGGGQVAVRGSNLSAIPYWIVTGGIVQPPESHTQDTEEIPCCDPLAWHYPSCWPFSRST